MKAIEEIGVMRKQSKIYVPLPKEDFSEQLKIQVWAKRLEFRLEKVRNLGDAEISRYSKTVYQILVNAEVKLICDYALSFLKIKLF
jgi:hypothetical protein